MMELLIQLFPLVIIIFAAFLLLAITLWERNSPAKLRDIPALSRLYRMLGLSVEDGTRLHISLGHGNLLDARGGSAFWRVMRAVDCSWLH